MTDTLPGMSTPTRRDYQQVARAAVNEARQLDRAREYRKQQILAALKYCPLREAALYRVLGYGDPRNKRLQYELLELLEEGRIINGPQGWSVK